MCGAAPEMPSTAGQRARGASRGGDSTAGEEAELASEKNGKLDDKKSRLKGKVRHSEEDGAACVKKGDKTPLKGVEKVKGKANGGGTVDVAAVNGTPTRAEKRTLSEQSIGAPEEESVATKRSRGAKKEVGGEDATTALERSDADSQDEADNVDAFFFGSADADDCDVDDDAWRLQLEELRRRRKNSWPPASEGASSAIRPVDQAQLLREVRVAVQSGDWTPVACPLKIPRQNVVAQTVQDLHDHEVFALVRACGDRYESHPRERTVLTLWLSQVLASRSGSLVGRRELQEAFRPLRKTLAARFDEQKRRSGQINTCLGRWKLVRALAQARRGNQVDAGDDADADDKAAGVDDADEKAAADSDDE
eukprot:TRINITY_DN121228_c0_g1_i1.p1 TRINITY_DN121228_c0_g1~~TRINITY_DN121228_c0_g1_i1.p1  ORF type:complete len:365 (-),score=98.48 TRINITY_DN121228_c0_g1_i1:192-1286(-)